MMSPSRDMQRRFARPEHAAASSSSTGTFEWVQIDLDDDDHEHLINPSTSCRWRCSSSEHAGYDR